MAGSNAILLVESEEQVIKDIVCSLRLINVPVLASRDIAAAKQSARQQKPALILARLRLQGDEAAGITLARQLAGEKELDDIPVVVLCTAGEKQQLEEHGELFDGYIHLPVEFPLFTRQVQGMLDRLRGGAEVKTMPAPQPPSAVLPHPAENEAAENRLHRNLAAVCGIQHEVLSRLKHDKALATASEEQVPSLVAEITRQVCGAFNPKKPI